MKTEDYIKYLSVEFTKYIELPKEEKLKRRQIRKQEKELPMKKYFGVLPMAISLWFSSIKGKIVR